MHNTEAASLPWIGLDPAAWLRNWQQAWRGAPDTLMQPILPGWTLNINSNNSSSPQTEVDVVSRHSYGRQIGRIADALEALIERQGKPSADARFAEFLKLKQGIDAVKQASAIARIEQLKKDLESLKTRNRADYERARAALREVLTA
jgi:hypothetical protein